MKEKSFDILLVSMLPLFRKKPKIRSYDPADEISPSLSLAYLAASLNKSKYNVKIYDSILEDYPEYSEKKFIKKILNIKSRVLGINIHATASYPDALLIANLYNFKKSFSLQILMNFCEIGFL